MRKSRYVAHSKPSLYRRFRLFTYHHPHAYSAMKRGLVIGGLTLGLGVRSRQLRQRAEKTLMRSQVLHANLQDLKTGFHLHSPDRIRRRMRALRRAVPRLERIRRTLSTRANRATGLAKIAGAGGAFYAGMPVFAERGARKHLVRQRTAYPAVTVVHKRGRKVVQRRVLA